ncbi:hypothetical protein L0156_15315 [bacterium]|nr:hypothetical protein [bacterium]
MSIQDIRRAGISTFRMAEKCPQFFAKWKEKHRFERSAKEINFSRWVKNEANRFRRAS